MLYGSNFKLQYTRVYVTDCICKCVYVLSRHVLYRAHVNHGVVHRKVHRGMCMCLFFCVVVFVHKHYHLIFCIKHLALAYSNNFEQNFSLENCEPTSRKLPLRYSKTFRWLKYQNWP
uniref:Uncharacterized protein n=1 Tax=Cacopsylla melanoneura TaxID=428564 RepID=A0A8D9E7W8_9HEMI